METQTSIFDLTKEDKAYYQVGASPTLVDLDTYCYLTFEGRGNPEHTPFQQAIKNVYAVAGTIRQFAQREMQDFEIPPMECNWWIEGGLEKQHLFMQTPPEQWYWKIQIRMPDWIEKEHYQQAVRVLHSANQLGEKNTPEWECINEGRCIQILHIGSWEAEGPSIAKILEQLEKEGLKINGYHKEIYLSEPEMVPENEKETILRYQISKR